MVNPHIGLFSLPKLEEKNNTQERSLILGFVILRLIRTRIAVIPKEETVRGARGLVSKNMEAVMCCL